MHPLDRIINRISPAVWNDALDIIGCVLATLAMLALVTLLLSFGAVAQP